VGERLIHFNMQATRWLGFWPKEHHNVRLKKARVAQNRLRRLTGQIGLSPEDCRRVRTACVRPLPFSEPSCGGRGRRKRAPWATGTTARAITGASRATNTGALSAEPGLLPAAAQLNNRKRRFAVRLISLPQGDQARELVGAASTLGSSLESFLGHPDRREETVLLESVEHLDTTTVVEDEARAKYEAERQRPGLVIFTDRSRTEGGATGHAAVWEKNQTWKGLKARMSRAQEVYDTDVQSPPAPMRRQPAGERMTSDDLGPGQRSALAARMNSAARSQRSGSKYDGAPATTGSKTTRKPTSGPSSRRTGRPQRGMAPTHGPLWKTASPCSLKRNCSEAKWTDASKWVKAQATAIPA